MSTAVERAASMEKIVALCKRRGFVYPGSDIYGGLANTWDYGPLGVELKNNIKQLTTALINMDSGGRALPGYVNELPDTGSPKVNGQYSIARRASWLVMTFPYMEQQALYDEWSGVFGTAANRNNARAPYIDGLVCPSNPPDTPSLPWLSYVANAGQALSDVTRGDSAEYAGNGLFFDNCKNPNVIPNAALDGREGHPKLSVRLGSIPDGTSRTILLSENVHTFYWTYSLESGTGDGDGISPEQDDNPTTMEAIPDAKHLFGFVWSHPQAAGLQPLGHINQDKNIRQSTLSEFWPLANASVKPFGKNETLGYPSSIHPAGVNMAFGDSHIEFIAETIDPRVYAQLMTSNAKRSTLVWGGVKDAMLPQPADDEY